MVTTKIFKNTTKEDIYVTGIGTIEAGQQISMTSEYHQPVILENFPGIIDITDRVESDPDNLADEEPNSDELKEIKAADTSAKGEK